MQTEQATGVPPPVVVIDTNIVLDLLVFDDPCWAELRTALDAGTLRWIATPPMRIELERVLGYPMIARRLVRDARAPDAVLALFDAKSHTVAEIPARAPFVCKDPDDQMFIDLAVACRARLLSKDRLVLALRKRLATLGVAVGTVFTGQHRAGLDALFRTPGKRWFQYDNKHACVQRMSSGSLQVMSPLDRLVQIFQGVATNEHVLQGDIVSFLTAGKNA